MTPDFSQGNMEGSPWLCVPSVCEGTALCAGTEEGTRRERVAGKEQPRRDLPDTEISSSVSTVLTEELLLGKMWT